MRTLFEMVNYSDIGDAESGPIVRECTDYYDVEVNLSQPPEKIRKEVLDKYMEYTKDCEFISADVVRIVPEDEAADIRKDMYELY